MNLGRLGCWCVTAMCCASGVYAAPLFTERLSVNPVTGASADKPSIQAAISGDGCVVAFQSTASNLVDPSFGIGTMSPPQVYAVNRCVAPHTIELISVDTTGAAPANGTNSVPNVSADGRYVAFRSNASNLPGGANNGTIFIRDRMTQTTTSPLAASQATALIYNDDNKPYMSADGAHLVLDVQDTGIPHNLYLFDLSGSTITMQAICPPAAMSAATPCKYGTVSAEGTAVVFDTSYALVAADTNGFDDEYIYDVGDASFRLVSVNADGTQGNDNVNGNGDALSSGNGSIVVFFDYLASALGGTGNSLLRKDLTTGALTKLNLDEQGQVVGINPPNPSISDDGSLIGFTALSTRPLVLHPNQQQTDTLLSVASSPQLVSACRSSAAAYGDQACESLKVSGDGRWATFDSYSGNLDSAGTNGFPQVFVTDVRAVLDLVFYDSFENQ